MCITNFLGVQLAQAGQLCLDESIKQIKQKFAA